MMQFFALLSSFSMFCSAGLVMLCFFACISWTMAWMLSRCSVSDMMSLLCVAVIVRKKEEVKNQERSGDIYRCKCELSERGREGERERRGGEMEREGVRK